MMTLTTGDTIADMLKTSDWIMVLYYTDAKHHNTSSKSLTGEMAKAFPSV
jgi:hypothetical protein